MKWPFAAWVASLLHRFEARKAITQARSAPGLKSTRQLCEQLLIQLKPELFQAYQVYWGQGVQITAIAANVESYTARLKEAVSLVRQDRPINPLWSAVLEDCVVSVDRFLVSRDGFYINQEKALAEFRQAGLQLCEALQLADSQTSGLYEHNLRVMTRLFVNLRTVTAALVEVSLIK